MARRSALALLRLAARGLSLASILTPTALENAMLLHAAFGGSTNLLLHIPAIAHAAGLPRPTIDDWNRINRATPRLVDALPNGPRNHPTVQVFLAGGVPEVMLHLRDLGPAQPRRAHRDRREAGRGARLVGGRAIAAAPRARACAKRDGVDPDHVIMSADGARRAGLTSTVVFPVGQHRARGLGGEGDRRSIPASSAPTRSIATAARRASSSASATPSPRSRASSRGAGRPRRSRPTTSSC